MNSIVRNGINRWRFLVPKFSIFQITYNFLPVSPITWWNKLKNVQISNVRSTTNDTFFIWKHFLYWISCKLISYWIWIAWISQNVNNFPIIPFNQPTFNHLNSSLKSFKQWNTCILPFNHLCHLNVVIVIAFGKNVFYERHVSPHGIVKRTSNCNFVVLEKVTRNVSSMKSRTIRHRILKLSRPLFLATINSQ